MKLTGLTIPSAKVDTKVKILSDLPAGTHEVIISDVAVDETTNTLTITADLPDKPKPLFAGLARKLENLESNKSLPVITPKESHPCTPSNIPKHMAVDLGMSEPKSVMVETHTSGEDVYVTAIHKETLEPRDIRLPNAEEQPRMAAVKKPVSGETITSSPVEKKNPFAKKQKSKNPLAHLGNVAKAGQEVYAKSSSSLTHSTSDSVSQKKPLNLLGKSKLEVGKQKSPSKPLQEILPSKASTGGKLNLFAKKKSAKPKVVKDPTLYGTGLTKAKLGQAAKLQEKAEATDKSAIETIHEGELLPSEIDLPDSLMDDSIVLDEYQRAAVDGLYAQKFGVLIGAAGTGKTTALKEILGGIEDSVGKLNQKDLSTYKETHDAIEGLMPAIAFCSFTGKAVQQMKRALPAKYHPLANTIHSTLGYSPVEEEYMDKETHEWKTHKVFRPTYTKYAKLPYKVILVDEGGTVPVNLWHELYDAAPDDCRILILGDLNQLPPVAGHSILGFAMLKWPTYVLEKLHRQAEGDPIAENAHRILAGKKPMTDKETMKFVVKPIEDGSKAARKQILGTIQHLHKQGVFDPMLDALIVPQNIGNIGQIELNTVLVNYFNPSKRDENGTILNKRHIITAGYAHVMFAAGDKVMLTANDTTKQLTNGMVGVVLSIEPNQQFAGERVAVAAELDLTVIDLKDLDFAKDLADDDEDETPESERAASHTMMVKLQNVDEPVEFSSAGSFKKVMLAYAMTCHKAQGSEYRNVIAVAHASNIKMLTREWLYTAITRAKQRVILLCNHRGLTHAVNNQRIKGDTIAEKAKKFLALDERQIGKQEVRLPEPEEIKSLTMTRGE